MVVSPGGKDAGHDTLGGRPTVMVHCRVTPFKLILSTTLTVNVYVPFVVGVPPMAPVAVFVNVSPGGREPTEMDTVSGGLPPDGVAAELYAMPTSANVAGHTNDMAGTMRMVQLAVPTWPNESLAVTVKLAVPAWFGVPVMSPWLLLCVSVNPKKLAGDAVMLVNVPDPPDAMALHDVSMPEHANDTPTSARFFVGHATVTAGFTVMGQLMVVDASDASVTVMDSDCGDVVPTGGVQSTRPVVDPMVAPGGAEML